MKDASRHMGSLIGSPSTHLLDFIQLVRRTSFPCVPFGCEFKRRQIYAL